MPRSTIQRRSRKADAGKVRCYALTGLTLSGEEDFETAKSQFEAGLVFGDVARNEEKLMPQPRNSLPFSPVLCGYGVQNLIKSMMGV